MTKRLTLLMVASSLYFTACGDSTSGSGPDSLTYVNEDGEEISIDVSTGSFKDPRDGKSYNTVTIGEQTWMTENLTYAGEGSGTSDEKYGWGSAQVACPEGWHLSQRDEWQDLFETIEKVYGDSAGWVLKSTSGWANDTTDGEIVSGNGGNILGFDIKPTGICRGYDCRYQGKMTGFWTMSKKDRDGYADYIRFDVDPSWHPGEIYSDARLHVRCVSDKGTIFESLGKCTEEKESSVGEHKSSFYICKDGFWETANLEQKLNFAIGECNAEIANQRFMLQDTSFLCEASEYSTIVYPTPDGPGEIGYTTSYHWIYTPKDTILKECEIAGDTLCLYIDSTFHYSLGYWYEAHINEVKKCDSTINGEMVSLNKQKYVCQDNKWKVASQADEEEGLCDASRQYDMITIGKGEFNSQKYVCAGNRWYPLQAPEDSLGLCTNNGEKGTYRGQEFICNTSEHIWYHHFTDSRDNREYRSVLLRGMLIMAENVKYGGDSMYVWHEAMALDESCDSLYCAEADFDTSGHQGICPDGWELLTASEASNLLDFYAVPSIYTSSSTDDDYHSALSRNGWPRPLGNNRSGLNFTPNKIDTAYAMETYVISSSSHSMEIGTRSTGEIEYIEYNASTWISKESTGSWSWPNKPGDRSTIAYQLHFHQTVYFVGTYDFNESMSPSSDYKKKSKAPVRCKKKLL